MEGEATVGTSKPFPNPHCVVEYLGGKFLLPDHSDFGQHITLGYFWTTFSPIEAMKKAPQELSLGGAF